MGLAINSVPSNHSKQHPEGKPPFWFGFMMCGQCRGSMLEDHHWIYHFSKIGIYEDTLERMLVTMVLLCAVNINANHVVLVEIMSILRLLLDPFFLDIGTDESCGIDNAKPLWWVMPTIKVRHLWGVDIWALISLIWSISVLCRINIYIKIDIVISSSNSNTFPKRFGVYQW